MMYNSTMESYSSDLKLKERKFNKHLIEKRRRGRINSSLDQLKSLVLSGLNKDPSQYDKMEKADILELTVQYMAQISRTPHSSPEMSPESPVRMSNFRAGYEGCLQEVSKFVNNYGMDQGTTSRLVGHLETRVQDTTPSRPQQILHKPVVIKSAPMSPAGVHLPTTSHMPVAHSASGPCFKPRKLAPVMKMEATDSARKTNDGMWRPWEVASCC